MRINSSTYLVYRPFLIIVGRHSVGSPTKPKKRELGFEVLEMVVDPDFNKDKIRPSLNASLPVVHTTPNDSD